MNKALLTRNLFLLKKNYLKYVTLLFLVPMFLYIANVLFFSNYLDDLIKDWACMGVWVSSSILCSYIYMYDIMSGIRSESNKFNFIVISPASILNILLLGILGSLLMGFIELIIAYIITYALTGTTLTFSHFIYLILSVFSINLFFISIAIFLGLYDRHNIGLAVLTLFCGSILQFSYTIHYPIDNLTPTYNPIFNIIINSSALLLSKYVFSFNPILIMAAISVSFLIISCYISIRLIKGKYER